MSFDWRKYIKLAEDLLGQGDEAHWRSSISRESLDRKAGRLNSVLQLFVVLTIYMC